MTQSARYEITETASGKWVVLDHHIGLYRGRFYTDRDAAVELLREIRKLERNRERAASKPRGTGRQIRGWSRQDGFA